MLEHETTDTKERLVRHLIDSKMLEDERVVVETTAPRSKLGHITVKWILIRVVAPIILLLTIWQIVAYIA